MDEKIKNKRGQIAIFVIIAILLVGGIALLFFIGGNDKGKPVMPTDVSEAVDIQSAVVECALGDIEDKLDYMIYHGGLGEVDNSVMVNGTKIGYLCKNNGNYETCINQHPMLLNEMKVMLNEYVSPKINSCFEGIQDAVKNDGGTMTYDNIITGVEFAPDKVFVRINSSVKIEKEGNVQTFDKFDFEIKHPAYNLVYIANEIASQEAKYCYFEYVGYMAMHPRYRIWTTMLIDSTATYRIKDSKSEKEMNIAIRGCGIPPGI